MDLLKSEFQVRSHQTHIPRTSQRFLSSTEFCQILIFFSITLSILGLNLIGNFFHLFLNFFSVWSDDTVSNAISEETLRNYDYAIDRATLFQRNLNEEKTEVMIISTKVQKKHYMIKASDNGIMLGQVELKERKSSGFFKHIEENTTLKSKISSFTAPLKK